MEVRYYLLIVDSVALESITSIIKKYNLKSMKKIELKSCLRNSTIVSPYRNKMHYKNA